MQSIPKQSARRARAGGRAPQGLLLFALLLHPEPARACGGFYCQTRPVLQAAERIVFEVDGPEVTAYIQIQYTGSDTDFAWVVPVPEVPVVETGVGQAMFEALEAQTRPVFRGAEVAAADALVAPQSAGCGFGPVGPGVGGPVAGVNAEAARRGEPELHATLVPPPEVSVYERARIGPYEYAVVDAANAGELDTWLTTHGYRLVPGSGAVVQAYLDEGMKLLALRLAPGAGVQALEPLKLTYRDTRGCAAIPLRLTAIASVADTEVLAWVFGSGRVAPVNFRALALSSVRIESGAAYAGAVEALVEAADGRAFITEYARSTAALGARGDATLQGLLSRHRYVTRLRTYVDPEDMTADPRFEADPAGGDVDSTVELVQVRSASAGSLLLLLALGLALRPRRAR